MTCSDWIGLWGAIASSSLGALALWQNHRYKKQADSFSDTQFMPEFFFVDEDGYITTPKQDGIVEVASLGYGSGQDLGKYFAINTPIYNLKISEVVIDGKRVDTTPNTQTKTADIYPTNPYFRIRISIPDEISQITKRCKGAVFLTYENMYSTKYKKEIDFIYMRESPNCTIHSREIKHKRAERYKAIPHRKKEPDTAKCDIINLWINK